MSGHLLIRDGNPKWWLSTDIWTVPGTDPNGPQGPPIAGHPVYVWGHIANTGDQSLGSSRIDFYWANPATQILVGTATPIGSAFVDLAPKGNPGDAQDVVCLVPWKPTIVNNGHECLLAVAHNPSEDNPLPDPLPSGYDFDPPAHEQIAQRNMSVFVAMQRGIPLGITIAASQRADKKVVVTAEIGGAVSELLIAQLRLDGFRPADHEVLQVHLSREPLCHDKANTSRELEMRIPRGMQAGVFLTIEAAGLKEHEYQLVHVMERNGDRVLGGISYAVVKQSPGGKK